MTDATPVTGELTFETVLARRAELEQALAGGGSAVLDLSGVTRADSAGLSLLLELERFARRRGGQLRFRGVPAQLQKLIGFFGLGEMLPAA